MDDWMSPSYLIRTGGTTKDSSFFTPENYIVETMGSWFLVREITARFSFIDFRVELTNF